MKEKISLFLVFVGLLCSCDCEHSAFEGNVGSIVAFTLSDNSTSYPLTIYKDSVVFNAPDKLDVAQLMAKVTLSEGATITPDPTTQRDWSKPMKFQVTAPNNQVREYVYKINLTPSGDYYDKIAYLTTQQEVNDFAAKGYSKAFGIRIESVNTEDQRIVDLSGLSTITEITTTFHLENYYGETLVGLENLKSATTIEISNRTIQSISLDNLTKITNLVIGFVYSAPQPATCSGLTSFAAPNLEYIAGDFILRSEIKDYSGLQNLKKVEGEMILQNAAINFRGLEKLAEVNYLTITGSSALETCEGLSGLKVVNKLLRFSFLNKLATLNGLAIEQVDQLVLNNIQKLVDLTALSSITKLESLEINGLAAIGSLEGLHNLKTVNGNVFLQFLGVAYGDGPRLADFKGLRSLETIGGTLSIQQCPKVTSLDGFEKLKSVGGIKFSGLRTLANINGFSNLENVTNTLDISGSLITTLAPLAKLKSFQSIVLKSNSKLVDYCAIKSLLVEKGSDSFTFMGNKYNPTLAELKSGRCLQK